VDDDLNRLAHYLAGCLGEDETSDTDLDDAIPHDEPVPDDLPAADPPEDPGPGDRPEPDSPHDDGNDELAGDHCIAELNAGRYHYRFPIHSVQTSRSIPCREAKALFDEYFERRGTEARGELRVLRIDEWTCWTPDLQHTAALCADDDNGNRLSADVPY
jgi:hypothetical protein